MYAELEKAGELEAWAIQAAEHTSNDMESLMNAGFTWEDAWEQVRERYLFLPTEEDRPEL